MNQNRFSFIDRVSEANSQFLDSTMKVIRLRNLTFHIGISFSQVHKDEDKTEIAEAQN